MAANLSISPYFDDFNQSAGFHQILFKPGYSVQARELTQLQSILRDQIAKFGGHVFKHGSVVIPGNTGSDLNVGYVKLQTTVDSVVGLEGKTVVGGTSGLKAKIRTAVDATGTDPATMYITYFNTGTAGQRVFVAGETLSVDETSLTFTAGSGTPTGGGSIAFINRGVFFINGSFVQVEPQIVVIGKYTTTPSCHVLLQINESIVDSNTDASLLDPAQGSYNFAAPGADRLKIILTLVTLPLNSTITENYVEMMRFEDGVLLEHARYPKYNELEKNLARRTYEESGDYVVSGLGVTSREHLKVDLNGGRYTAALGGDPTKMIYTVGGGKAYVNGFENEVFSARELIVPKAQDINHVKDLSANVVPSYGQFIYVSNPVNLPDFKKQETITFYDAASGGSSIGTATAIAFDYVEPNTTDTNAIFKLFISTVNMNAGKSVADIGRLAFSGGSATVLHKLNVLLNTDAIFSLGEIASTSLRTSTVHKFTKSTGELYVYKHDASKIPPQIGDLIVGGTSTAQARVTGLVNVGKNAGTSLIVPLPFDTIYRVKNSINASDMVYKFYYYQTVAISGGTGSFTVSGMTIDPKEQGSFIIVSSAGVHPLSVATVDVSGLSVTFSGVSPASTTLYVACAATKTAAQATNKTKTIVLNYSQSGLTPSAKVLLNKADAVRLRSVISTTQGDVTNKFTLDSGQTDYYYGRAFLNQKGTSVTGTLTVTYDYFQHNAGSGDFFSVDSYESSGLTDYYANKLLKYTSRNSGMKYDLRNCLDFRPRLGDDGTFSSGSAVLTYIPIIDSRLTTSVRKYVGRSDLVIMEKDGNIRSIQGTPSLTPIRPNEIPGSISLAYIAVPPYTYTAADVKITIIDNIRYTMKDIGKLDKRIAAVEDFVTLTETESNTVNYDVVDATTGLSRFKSGFLVDTFNDPDVIGDNKNPYFKVSYTGDTIIPQFEVFETPATIFSNAAQIYTQTENGITYSHLMAPAVSKVLMGQPMSSRVTNLNPFLVMSWTGNMTIYPSVDTWFDIDFLPTVYRNVTEEKIETEYYDVRLNWWDSAPGGSIVIREPSPVIFWGDN